MGTVLIPIPDRDFDPTEVAVSWRVLTRDGHRVVFATESGALGAADDIMVTGRGLDIWSAIPALGAIPMLGLMLRANKDGRSAYRDMLRSNEFQHPVTWTQATLDGIDALLLPGGHRARGMRSFIDSETLQRLVVDAFARGVLVAAICHGVLLAARSVDPDTGRSVLYHGVDLGNGAPGLAAHADHPILGSRLLPDLHRGTRPTRRVYVRAVGSHSCP
jgi:putative intracellular protease/amidase